MYGPARDLRVSIFKEEKCADLMQRAAGGDGVDQSPARTCYHPSLHSHPPPITFLIVKNIRINAEKYLSPKYPASAE